MAAPPYRHKEAEKLMRTRQAKGIDLCYLCERPGAALDAELRVAQLAVAGVRRRQPLLQAALVHRAQRARAVAWRQQALAAAPLVADAANGTITEKKSKWNYIDSETAF